MSDASRDAEEVAAYYARGLERDRLASGPGALEFARTQALLERYLPAPPAEVADVGGGPGRYAVWLAERGYRVHLIDPVPLHVEQARAPANSRPAAPLPAPKWATPARFGSPTRSPLSGSAPGPSTPCRS